MTRKSFLSSLSGVAAACALQCFGVSEKISVPWVKVPENVAMRFDRAFYGGDYPGYIQWYVGGKKVSSEQASEHVRRFAKANGWTTFPPV